MRSMLAQNDQIWHLSASAVNVEVNAFGTHNFEVDINKDLVLSGCSLYNFIASDLTVNDATNSTISTSANMQFISDSTFTFVLPQSLLQVYYEGVYIGYTELNGVEMYPGLNILSNQSLVIESYPENNNREVLNDFFGGYMAGNDQMVTLKGPIANNVLNGILELNVTSQGYNGPAITFGGLVTKTTLGMNISTRKLINVL